MSRKIVKASGASKPSNCVSVSPDCPVGDVQDRLMCRLALWRAILTIMRIVGRADGMQAMNFGMTLSVTGGGAFFFKFWRAFTPRIKAVSPINPRDAKRLRFSL